MASQENIDQELKRAELELKHQQIKRSRDEESFKWINKGFAAITLASVAAALIVFTYNELVKWSEGRKALENVGALKKELIEYKIDKIILKSDNEAAQDRLDEARSQLSASRDYLNSYNHQFEDLKHQYEKLKHQVDKLEEKRKILQSKLAYAKLNEARRELDLFFQRAEMRLDTIWRLCRRPHGSISGALVSVREDFGPLDQEKLPLLRSLNSVFFPLIDSDPFISSMMIVGPKGFSYVALDEREFPESQEEEFAPYTWRNRLTRIPIWDAAHEWYWRDNQASKLKGENNGFVLDKLIVEGSNGQLEEKEYNPHLRRYAKPWLVEDDEDLWSPRDPNIHWTPPYIFFTRRTPGVTASRGWKNSIGQKFVVAVDFTLTELSVATTRLRIGERGVVFMFSETGTIVSLPYHADKFGNGTTDKSLAKKIQDYFSELMAKSEKEDPGGLRPDQVPRILQVGKVAESLELNALEAAFDTWDEKAKKTGSTEQLEFPSDGESWTGLFVKARYPHGNRSVVIAAIAPSEDLRH